MLRTGRQTLGVYYAVVPANLYVCSRVIHCFENSSLKKTVIHSASADFLITIEHKSDKMYLD